MPITRKTGTMWTCDGCDKQVMTTGETVVIDDVETEVPPPGWLVLNGLVWTDRKSGQTFSHEALVICSLSHTRPVVEGSMGSGDSQVQIQDDNHEALNP